MKGCITTTVHLVCFTNEANDKYLSTHPKFGWTDNFNFARCYDTIEEAKKFLYHPIVKSYIGSKIVHMVWTDTKELIL